MLTSHSARSGVNSPTSCLANFVVVLIDDKYRWEGVDIEPNRLGFVYVHDHDRHHHIRNVVAELVPNPGYRSPGAVTGIPPYKLVRESRTQGGARSPSPSLPTDQDPACKEFADELSIGTKVCL